MRSTKETETTVRRVETPSFSLYRCGRCSCTAVVVVAVVEGLLMLESVVPLMLLVFLLLVLTQYHGLYRHVLQTSSLSLRTRCREVMNDEHRCSFDMGDMKKRKSEVH